MKLIEKGEPIDIEKLGWVTKHLYIGDQAKLEKTVEDKVHYLAEIQPIVDWENKQILITITILGKKQDFMCGDCGSKFISHKGLCTNCYVRAVMKTGHDFWCDVCRLVLEFYVF